MATNSSFTRLARSAASRARALGFEEAFPLSGGITSFYFRAASIGDVSKDQHDPTMRPSRLLIGAPRRRSDVWFRLAEMRMVGGSARPTTVLPQGPG